MNSLSVLNSNDLNWCLHRLPKRVKSLMQEYAGQLVMAGGFIRACIANEHINDVDLFPASKELAQVMALKLAGGDLKGIHETENAYTVSRHLPMSVQFIHRWIFYQPEDILPSFDFTIAQAAIWFEATAFDGQNGKVIDGRWKSLCSDQFYPDLAAKRLVYLQPIRNEDAGGSMLRVLKFYQRGYRIPIDSLGAVIARLISGIDVSRILQFPAFDKNRLSDGTRLQEDQVSKVVTGLLREVDPLIDPAHVSHLPATEAVGVTRDAEISTRPVTDVLQ